MKKVRLYEEFHFTNEAKRGTIHKAVKAGDYPVTIVVIENGKVVHQEQVSTPEAVPASFNVLQKEYPKAKLHVEDKGGAVLFKESVEINEGKYLKKLDRLAVKFEGASGFATLDEESMAKYIDMETADELADEMFGEFGFASLSEEEMEAVLKSNPKIIK